MEAEFILLLRQVRQEKYQSIHSFTPPQFNSQVDVSIPTSKRRGSTKLNNNVTGSSTNLSTVNTPRKNYSGESDFIHQLDDPSNVAIPFQLEASQVQLILVRLLDVIQRQIKSGELETPDDWQAQVIQILIFTCKKFNFPNYSFQKSF